MKKKYGLLFILCLLMFFCVNIDGVKADDSAKRIQCFYTGEVAASTNGTGQKYDIGIGISYYCGNNDKCSATFYGRIADHEDPLNIKAREGKLGDKGFKKTNNGEIECYDKISVGPYNSRANSINVKFEGNGFTLNRNDLSGSGSWKEKVDAYIEGKHGSYSTTGRGSEDYDANSTINQDMVDGIIENAEEQEEKQKNADIGITDDDVPSCSKVLGDEFSTFLKNAFLVISIFGVVLLIILMSMDFVKVIASGEADAMADAFKRSKNRIISVIILLLLPTLVNFIIGIANNNLHMEDGNITVGNVSECDIYE